MPAPARRTSSAASPQADAPRSALPRGRQRLDRRRHDALGGRPRGLLGVGSTYDRRCGRGPGDDACLDDFAAKAHGQAIFSSRMALVAAACGALAAPGVARAAGSPPGMSMSDLTTTVDSALAQVDAAAPGAGAAARPAVMQALGAASALSSLAGGPAPPAGPPAPTSLSSRHHGRRACRGDDKRRGPGLRALRPLFRPLPTRWVRATRLWQGSTGPSLRRRPRARRFLRLQPAITRAWRRRRSSPRRQCSPPRRLGRRPAGWGSGARRSGGRSTGDSPTGSTSPRPLPPVPPGPDGPGLTSPGLGGVPGPLLPLLVAALAAALAFASFPFVSRRLPRSAFRKPRRVALAVWHPG